MADIFISYARADQEVAKTFAGVFASRGWTVWWDPEIFYGTQYDKVIEDELVKAKCIIVLWSKRSVESRWVRSEASHGVERNALIPVRIEADAKVPLEFTKIQTAELAGWDGDCENSTFEGLIRGIERLILSAKLTSRGDGPVPVSEQHASANAPKRRMLIRLGLLAAPTLVALLLSGIAMRIYRLTAFDLEMSVSKVAFVSIAEQAALLVDKTPFKTLTLHGIEKGSITGDRVELAQEAGNSTEVEKKPVDRPQLSIPVAIVQRGTSGATVILCASRSDEQASGELDRLYLATGARAEVEVTPDKYPGLLVRLPDQALRIVVSLYSESDVDLVGAMISSSQNTPNESAAISLRVLPAKSGSFIELESTVAGPTFLLEPAGDTRASFGLVSNLRVSEIEFQAQGLTGAAVTTISGEGTISFPEMPDKAKVAVRDGDTVVLGDLRNFFLRKLVFQMEQRALRLEAGGFAGSLRSGPRGGIQERAFTWFDSIWHQPRSVQLFGLAVWLFPTTIAAYKLLKDIRK